MTPNQLEWLLAHNEQIRGSHRAQIADAVEAWRKVEQERDAWKESSNRNARLFTEAATALEAAESRLAQVEQKRQEAERCLRIASDTIHDQPAEFAAAIRDRDLYMRMYGDAVRSLADAQKALDEMYQEVHRKDGRVDSMLQDTYHEPRD